MGLWNIFITKTLKMTSADYYVLGTCPPEVGRLVSRAKAARRGPGVRNFIAFSIRLLPKEI